MFVVVGLCLLLLVSVCLFVGLCLHVLVSVSRFFVRCVWLLLVVRDLCCWFRVLVVGSC